MSSLSTLIPFTFEVEVEVDVAESIGQRETQEDSVLIEHTSNNRHIRIAIADGLGGHLDGEIASETAVQESMQVLRSDDEEDASTFHDLFRAAFLAADKAISRNPWHPAKGAHPASTLINALIYGQGEVRLAGVGDSIVWALSDGHVHELLRPQGSGNCVRFSLGDDIGRLPGSVIEHASWQMKAGDRLLIATDGILSLSQADILNIVNLAETQPAWTLLAAVLAKHHEYQDNCVIVVVSAVEIPK